LAPERFATRLHQQCAFPSEYKGDIFAPLHGSWNRMKRTGCKVVRAPFDKSAGKARGEYEDFVPDFVTPDGKVWGRWLESPSRKTGVCLSAKTATRPSGA
jgi:glucose/arabinose dehydrogenase